MKIKHWQGYGNVNAVKVNDHLDGCDLHIKVSGDHEWGLVREDRYDIFNWLIKRFDKSIESYREFTMSVRPGYDLENHEETCDYLIYKCAA